MKAHKNRVIWTATALLAVQACACPASIAADDASRWEATIQKFETADRQSMPEPGGLLFVGSSSIRMWDTDRWFPGKGVINRGFGGSQISDVNFFVERIVLKYKPRTIVFYAGDNDVAKGKSAERVAADFRKFGDLIRRRLPECHLIYIPIKPSIARWSLWPEMAKANAAIRSFLEQHEMFHYAAIEAPMLGDDGKPREDIFREDGLHLNDQGYEIWTKIVGKLIDQADAQRR